MAENEMIDRVARTIHREIFGWRSGLEMTPATRNYYEGIAIKVIEAMFEPTAIMKAVGAGCIDFDERVDDMETQAAWAWRDMVRAALGEIDVVATDG